jgi:hypothetical protein
MLGACVYADHPICSPSIQHMERSIAFFLARAAEQVGKLLADAQTACIRLPPLRHGSTLRALRGRDPLGRAAPDHG